VVDRLHTYPNQRIDLLDFVLASQGTTIEELSRFFSALCLQQPTTVASKLALEGFAGSDGGGGQFDISLTNARAFMAEARDLTDHYGFLSQDEEGVTTISVQLAAYVGTVQDVYVRHFATPSDAANRVFWNPTTATEEVASVNTHDRPRLQADRVATGGADPFGGEGMKIAQVTIDGGGNITGIAMTRQTFWEGSEDSLAPTYTNYDFEPRWGLGANDENATRAADGVHDLYTFVQYCRRQIGEIIGDGLPGDVTGTMRPWTRVPNDVPSLADLVVQHFPNGHASAGNHKNIQIHNASPEISFIDSTPAQPNLIMNWEGATENFRIREGTLGTQSFVFGYPVAGDRRFVIPGPGAGGVDMGAGDFAYLMFGDDDLAAGEDFRLRAVGSAAAATRKLEFWSGDGGGTPTLRATVTGGGDIEAERNVICRAAGGTGEFQYNVARVWGKVVSGAAFKPAEPIGGGAVSGVETSRAVAGGTARFRFDNAAVSQFAVLDLGELLPANATITDISLWIDSGGVNHTITANVYTFDVTAGVADTYANPGSGAVTGTYNGAAGVQELDLSAINDLVGQGAAGTSMVLVVECASGGAATSYITGAEIDYTTLAVEL